MTTAVAAGGLVDLVPALAVMLGANVGTTLIVQLLSFDVSRVSFLLILLGVFMFRRSGITRTSDLGRVGIGLGLMLIGLQHLLSMIIPFEDVPSLRVLLDAVTTDPMIDILLAAVLTWVAHSSVAVVLLIMAFASQAVVPPHAAFALVLGANLGTALNPMLESGVGGAPAAKRLPIGNLINHFVGCALALALLKWIGPALVTIEPDAGRAVAEFHTGFTVVLALLFYPLLRPFARLLVRLLPARVDAADPPRPIYLDWAARETPSIALASAAREALRMVDVFEAMLRGALDSLNRGDRKRVAETARMDTVLDRLDTPIKEYLTSIDSDALDDADHRRLSEILAFTTNLEHAGDIVEKSLMPLAATRIKRGVSFSEADRDEIRELIERLTSNARAAAAVHDRGSARCPPAPRGKGSFSGARIACRRRTLWRGTSRPGREHRDQQAPTRHRARPQAGQRALGRGCLSDTRGARRAAAEPAQAGRMIGCAFGSLPGASRKWRRRQATGSVSRTTAATSNIAARRLIASPTRP